MNKDKARAVAAQVRAGDGEHWNQGAWWGGPETSLTAAGLIARECGTTACVAGWAAAMEYPDAFFAPGASIVLANGKQHAIRETAQAALELTFAQQAWLFEGDRTQEEVLWALENDDPDWDVPDDDACDCASCRDDDDDDDDDDDC